MNCDTPRTDEFIGEQSEWSPAPLKNWPAFARQLEKELNAARAELAAVKLDRDNWKAWGQMQNRDNWKAWGQMQKQEKP